MIHINPARRQPLNELDPTVRIGIPMELARLMVPDLDIAGGTGSAVYRTGTIHERCDEGLNYPKSHLDLITHNDGRCDLIVESPYGEPLFRQWVIEQVSKIQLTQTPALPIMRCA
jgi:hypothetical protein